MSKPFDQAFAKAFAQPSETAVRPRGRDIEPRHVEIPLEWDGTNQLIIQIPTSDVTAVPSPHIAIDGQTTTTEVTPQASPPPTADTPAVLSTETILAFADPVPTDWIVAAAGAELPSEASEDLSDPAVEDRERTAEQPAPPQATTVTDTPAHEERHSDEAPAESDDAISALDIPLLLEQEMLESLQRAADAVRSADTQLQRSTQQVQAFLPVWEIDRLHWPETIVELEARMGAELQGAAEGIRAAHADGMTVLGFTSRLPQAGRTTTLLLLAKSLRRLGLKIAIVDATNELATLTEQCGIDSPYGWNEAIVEQKPLEEAATYAVADGITIIAWTPGATDSLSRLPFTAVQSQWTRVRQAFDVVLLELPTVDAGVASALQRHPKLCDALVLVQCQADDPRDVAASIETLESVGIGAVGVIENQHPMRG